MRGSDNDNNNIPEVVMISGQRVEAVNIREYFVSRYGEPDFGYFVRAKAPDGRFWYIAAVCSFDASRAHKDADTKKNGWRIEWHETAKAASKAVRLGRKLSFIADDQSYDEWLNWEDRYGDYVGVAA